MSRAANMAEKADVKVEDILGQQGSHGSTEAFVDVNANAVSFFPVKHFVLVFCLNSFRCLLDSQLHHT